MLSDAPLYSEHRSMQIRDTELFIPTVIRKMDWSQEDIVMDIGCGPGTSTRTMLLPCFPQVKKVVAIDVLPDMIKFAKENNAHEKIDYHVANIEDKDSIEKWSEKISKIVSIYCFNWLGKQEEAFKNIFRVLKPGGEATLLFVLCTPFWDSYETHIQHPKYSKYLKDINIHVPESHYKKYGAEYYRTMLKDIGFNIIVCEDENRTFVYPNDDDCRIAAFSRNALSSHIPEELKEQFKEDVFRGFLKHNGRNSDGRPVLYYTTLTLLIQKPKV